MCITNDGDEEKIMVTMNPLTTTAATTGTSGSSISTSSTMNSSRGLKGGTGGSSSNNGGGGHNSAGGSTSKGFGKGGSNNGNKGTTSAGRGTIMWIFLGIFIPIIIIILIVCIIRRLRTSSKKWCYKLKDMKEKEVIIHDDDNDNRHDNHDDHDGDDGNDDDPAANRRSKVSNVISNNINELYETPPAGTTTQLDTMEEIVEVPTLHHQKYTTKIGEINNMTPLSSTSTS